MNLIEQVTLAPMTYLMAAGVGIVILYVKLRVAGQVDQRFAERLEEHKQNLNVITERAKFELQRDLEDFAHFVVRKHEAAAKCWAACRIAHGAVAGLFGISRELTFEEFNANDIRLHLESRGVPKGIQERVLDTWDSDRSRAVEELRPYLRMLKVQKADSTLAEAKNAVYLNELYFPDPVLKAFDGCFRAMDGWVLDAEDPPGAPSGRSRCSRTDLNDSLEAVHTILREYVSSGALQMQHEDDAEGAV